MKLIKALLFYLVLASLVSCDDITTISGQASTGGINEILVVTNNTQQWQGEIGDSIRACFTRDMKLLPIPEPQFKLVNIHESAISKDIFKKHHNIFIVNIDPSLKKALIESKKDLWAKPQIIIKIGASSVSEFLKNFEDIKENAFDLYVENERNRISTSYSSKFKNNAISSELIKYFHIDMNVPKGYSMARIDSVKCWIRKETAANSMDILVSVQKYESVDDFTALAIKKRRNNLTRLFIPGPTPGSYQLVADQYLEPISREISFNDIYAVETRGLWRVENDFMGGPFISYTFVDEKRNMLMTLDGFIYAPKQKKAPLMREIEAILWSVKFQ